MITRRLFLGGILAATGAPAIVRSGVLMPVRPAVVDIWNPANWEGGAHPYGTRGWIRASGREHYDGMPTVRDVWAGEPHASKCLGREIRRPDGIWVPFVGVA